MYGQVGRESRHQVSTSVSSLSPLDCDVFRPGQLGDTGIIVLQHCGPLKKKGCECSLDEEDEAKETKSGVQKEVKSYNYF